MGEQGLIGQRVCLCEISCKLAFSKICISWGYVCVYVQGEPGLEGEGGLAGPDGTKVISF